MELLYDVIITEDVAVGLRFSEESEEATLLSFLEDFSKPKPVECTARAVPAATGFPHFPRAPASAAAGRARAD